MYKSERLESFLSNIFNKKRVILSDDIYKAEDIKYLTETKIFTFTTKTDNYGYQRHNISTLKGDELAIRFQVEGIQNKTTHLHFLILSEEIKMIIRYDISYLLKRPAGNKFMAIELDDSLELEMWYRGYLKNNKRKDEEKCTDQIR